MGDAEFDNSNTIAADSIDLDLAMGNFTGSTVQAEQFTANISMGDFDLGLLAGVETAKVEAAMGDIGLTVDGRPDDYALDLQTSSGECGVQRQDDEQHLHPNSRRAPQRDPYRADGRCSADDDAVIPYCRGRCSHRPARPHQSHTTHPIQLFKIHNFRFDSAKKRFPQKTLYFVRGCGTIFLISK